MAIVLQGAFQCGLQGNSKCNEARAREGNVKSAKRGNRK